MTGRTLFIGLFLAVTGMLFVLPRKTGVVIRWKLEKGQVLKYRSGVIPGDDGEGDPEKFSIYDLEVVDVAPDGTFTLRKRYGGIPTTLTLLGRRRVPHVPPTYEMRPDGRVLGEGDSSLEMAVLAARSEDVRRSLLAFARSEDFVLPPSRVKPGATWTAAYEVEVHRAIRGIRQTYTLKSIEEGNARIVMKEEVLYREGVQKPERWGWERTASALFSVEGGVLLHLRTRKTTISTKSGQPFTRGETLELRSEGGGPREPEER